MIKIYAQQVPPEQQESPLFHAGSWPDNVYVFGNHHFNQHAERLEEIRAALQELAELWEDLTSGAPQYYNSWIETLTDM